MYSETDASAELCELAKESSLEKMRVLLACGVPINAADYDKRTALHLASSVGNLPIVKALLESNANPNAVDRWGGTPLRDAVRGNHEAVATVLRDAGGELGFDEVDASAELCELAKEGALEKMRVMLTCGVPINAADYDKRTALHLAASVGNLPIVKALLESGANANAKDRWGGTPTRDAVREGHSTVATALREAGGELDFSEADASGQLCELAHKGSRDLLSIMLDCGISVNAADYDRRTALHLAASEGNIHVVQLLLDRGANAFAPDRWGNFPRDDAVREGHTQVASLLNSAKDTKAKGEYALEGFAHMEEVRKWLLTSGFKEGRGLFDVLEVLDAQGIDTVQLLSVCWARLEPLLKVGSAARVGEALRSRT